MTGIENYNRSYRLMAKKRIEENKDIVFLSDFYDFLLSDTSFSGSYGYIGCVIAFIKYVNVSNPKDFTLNHFTKYLSANKTKSSSYQIMIYSALKKLSIFLKANDYCDDYMQFIKRPKFKESIATKKKRENGYMTEEETSLFIRNIKESNKKDCWKIRDISMIILLLNTGIRCSALQKLDINDINLENKTIEVLEKGDDPREICISQETVNELEKWLKYRETIAPEDETALFISNHKKRIDKKTIYNIIKTYGVVISGKNITPHKTRATYGTTLYNATHDLYFVQANMGHSSPKTTELYIRGQKKENAKKASQIITNYLV